MTFASPGQPNRRDDRRRSHCLLERRRQPRQHETKGDEMTETTTEVICGATAGPCRCGLEPGHDSPTHECSDRCRGAWKGELDTDSFEVVRWPGATDMTDQPMSLAEFAKAMEAITKKWYV